MIKEFLGIGGYSRPPEGFLSWQHIAFSAFLLISMFILGIFFGLRFRRRSDREKNRVIAAAAVIIDLTELIKITAVCVRSGSVSPVLYMLPLFLCSIMLIALPLAAFSRGKVREASLDFVFVFGLLIAIMGILGAGNNYSSYPVISIDNVSSGLTHAVSGFASLYIGICGMAEMKKENIPATFGIMLSFCAAAYVADLALDYNYMFLMRGDGTPYDIVYDLLGGNPVLYPVSVVVLFLLWITAFYLVYYMVGKARIKRAEQKEQKQ